MENYQEILDKQKELLPNDIKWWPIFYAWEQIQL